MAFKVAPLTRLDGTWILSPLTFDPVSNTNPVINLTGGSTLIVAQGSTFVDPGFTATDAEDGDITGSVVVTGTVDTSILDTYTITYSVVDSLGASHSVQRTVIVRAIPVISLIGSSSIVHVLDTAYNDAGATASDVEDVDITPSIVVSGTVDTATKGSYVLSYNVTDSDGFAAQEVQRTVLVRSLPSISLVGNSTINLLIGSSYTEQGVTAFDSEGNDISSNVVVTGTVDNNSLGSYTLSYSVTDSYGFESTTIQRTVEITARPEISLIGGTSIVHQQNTPFVDPGFTASDNEDGDITGSVVVTGTVNTSSLGQYTLTYSVVDSDGYSSPITQRLVVVRSVPSITLLGQSTVQLSQGSTYNEAGFTAFDSEGNNISQDVVVTGVIDNNTLGNYTLTYTVTDSFGFENSVQRTIQVTSLPVITLIGNATETIPELSTYVDPGATASDIEDGDLTNEITVSGSVNTSVPGVYVLEYNVSDSNGFSATTVYRTITVRALPVISLTGDSTVIIPLNGTYTEQNATAVDAEGNDISGDIVITGSVDTSVLGNVVVQYNVTDSQGYEALTVERTVSVRAKPVITLVGGNSIRLQEGSLYIDPGYIATDNEDGDISQSVLITGYVDFNTVGVYTLDYDVTDSDGYIADTVTRTVIVEPLNAVPTITLIGSGTVDVRQYTSYVELGAIVVDSFGDDITDRLTISGSVNVNVSGDYIISYNADDINGIQAPTVTRTVTVKAIPVINLVGANPLVLQQGVPFVEPGFAANDAEDGSLTSSVVVTGVVDTSTVGTYQLSYNVVDSDGYEAITVQRTINVRSLPVITLLGGQVIQLYRNETFNDPGATAVDSEGNDISNLIVASGAVQTDALGQYIVSYRVRDSYGFDSLVVNRVVNVVEADSAPYFVSLPKTSAVQGNLYVYSIFVADDNGDEVTLTLTEAPDWVVLEGNSLRCVPPLGSENNSYPIVIEASSTIFTAVQSFALQIIARPTQDGQREKSFKAVLAPGVYYIER